MATQPHRRPKKLGGKGSKKRPQIGDGIVAHKQDFYIPPLASSKFSKEERSLKSSIQHEPNYEPNKVKKAQLKARASAVLTGEQVAHAESWFNDKIHSDFEDVSLRLEPLNRTRDFASVGLGDRPQMSTLEMSIMRKILVRENLIIELMRLIQNQTDVGSCVVEVGELVKAIRFQTLDLVEEITSWINAQPNKRPFLYRGANYMIKLCFDLEFLDSYDEIVEWFCFEFKSNPLAYKGGGNIITGTDTILGEFIGGEGSRMSKSRSKLQAALRMKPQMGRDDLVDGIEVSRLKRAEQAIQRELERRRRPGQEGNAGGELARGDSFSGHPTETKPSAVSYLDSSEVPNYNTGDGVLQVDGSFGASTESMKFSTIDVGSPKEGGAFADILDQMRDNEYLKLQENSAIIDSENANLSESERERKKERSRSVTFVLGPQTLTDALSRVETDPAYSYFSSSEGFALGAAVDKVKKGTNRGNKGNSSVNADKIKPVISSRKKKQERITQLNEEAHDLKNKELKLSEKIDELVVEFQSLEDQTAALEKKRQEAIKKEKEGAAHKLGLEVSVLNVEKGEINQKIKDIQREMYFIKLEVDRREKLIARLDEDIKEEKKRRAIEAKLAAEIKKTGFIGAVQSLDSLSSLSPMPGGGMKGLHSFSALPSAGAQNKKLHQIAGHHDLAQKGAGVSPSTDLRGSTETFHSADHSFGVQDGAHSQAGSRGGYMSGPGGYDPSHGLGPGLGPSSLESAISRSLSQGDSMHSQGVGEDPQQVYREEKIEFDVYDMSAV